MDARAGGSIMGHIIVFQNNKGGVGKSTASAATAHALAMLGHRVLLVDADSQANATELLLPPKAEMNVSLYHLLRDHTPVEEVIQASKYPDLDLLPNQEITAGLEPSIMAAEAEKPGSQRYQQLRQRLRPYAKDTYDYTIIDTPPNLGTFVLLALNCADFVVVPVQADGSFSLKGLKNAVNTIEGLRASTNPDLRFLRLLVNMKDNRTSLGKAIPDKLKQSFSAEHVFSTEIRISTLFHKAEALGKTILGYDSHCRPAKDFLDVADELVSQLNQNE